MEYVVLARKLRPARFGDLVGQETVSRILQSAVRTDRVAHAFLFAGSRGVGKTSTARILTKLLNCENPQDAEPCDACGNCQEIAANTSPDVYEIDAASNRGIDNIRELRENLKYAPVKCRYKTYIIDEAHMLTMESFNALLKTLEEPPPHVKFILATTNPHKIPETILSRCQRFDFSRIPVGLMVDYLTRVTGEEGITISTQSLEILARNSAGGMRDVLTALDQVISYCGLEVPDDQVLHILGLMDGREVTTLLGAVLGQDLEAALEKFAHIVERGHDLQVLLESMLGEIKDLSLYLALGGDNPHFQDHPPDVVAFYSEQAQAVKLDQVQQLFALFLELEGQLKRSHFARACFEMALIKGCRVDSLVGVRELLDRARALAGGRAAPGGKAGGGGPAGGGRSSGPAAARAAAQTAGASSSPGAEGAAEAEAEPLAVETTSDSPPDEPPVPEQPTAEAEGEPLPVTEAVPENSPEEPPAKMETAAETREPVQPPPPEEPPAKVETAAEPAQPTPPAEASQETAAPSPLEDRRWQALIQAVKAGGKVKLSHDLRRVRVVALDAVHAELAPPDRLCGDTIEGEMAWLAGPLAEIFGESFNITLNYDKNGEAPGQSITERDQAREEARREALRAEALDSEAVQGVRRLFPEARVDTVHLPLSERDRG